MLKAGGYTNLNILSYNATFASAASITGRLDPEMLTPEWRAHAYEFCKSESYGTCNIYNVRSFGSSVTDKSMTSSLYQLINGSCGDPFSIAPSSFSQLINVVPTQLTESYYECHLSETDAVSNAIGIASGNTSTVVPVVIMALLPLIYLWLKAMNIPMPNKEYSDDDMKGEMEVFIKTILRAKNRKTRGMKKHGVLLKLVKEYENAVKNGSADTDDSDDSEEEDDDEAVEVKIAAKKSKRKSTKPSPNPLLQGNLNSAETQVMPRLSMSQQPDSDDEDGGHDSMQMRFTGDVELGKM